MDGLQEARKIINEVDSQMAQMFVRRMEAAEMVAEYKQAHGMPILDAAREEEVIRNGIERVERDELRGYYADFMHKNGGSKPPPYRLYYASQGKGFPFSTWVRM